MTKTRVHGSKLTGERTAYSNDTNWEEVGYALFRETPRDFDPFILTVRNLAVFGLVLRFSVKVVKDGQFDGIGTSMTPIIFVSTNIHSSNF